MDAVAWITLGVLVVVYVSTVGGTTCQVCTETAMKSNNDLMDSMLKAFVPPSTCGGSRPTQSCPAGRPCVITSMTMEMTMDAMPGTAITADYTSRECGDADTPDFRTCMDTSGITEANSFQNEMASEGMRVSSTKGAACFCITDNCNTEVGNIDPRFSGANGGGGGGGDGGGDGGGGGDGKAASVRAAPWLMTFAVLVLVSGFVNN